MRGGEVHEGVELPVPELKKKKKKKKKKKTPADTVASRRLERRGIDSPCSYGFSLDNILRTGDHDMNDNTNKMCLSIKSVIKPEKCTNCKWTAPPVKEPTVVPARVVLDRRSEPRAVQHRQSVRSRPPLPDDAKTSRNPVSATPELGRETPPLAETTTVINREGLKPFGDGECSEQMLERSKTTATKKIHSTRHCLPVSKRLACKQKLAPQTPKYLWKWFRKERKRSIFENCNRLM
ncbi:hypothetical protein B296_00049215 [Ensete ventricosum]|uniref:Uncharacterized protein n=1 Tax=Ensete ventricosum TaxID=4639 RepID=A0A426XLJ7_ENSVE|nr:hypothetical protein B296_00049215 [Ensete ventricosum]